MRLVIDGLPITGDSLAIVVEHLLEGWQTFESDDLHLVLGPHADLRVPAEVTVHRVEFGRQPAFSRVRAQSTVIPRLCRQLSADAMLGVLPTTTLTPLPCPRALIAYDLRHELRPEQFTPRSRRLRKASYDVGFRQADAIACISERTRADLLRSRPWLRDRPVAPALLGADHVDTWPAPEPGRPYALAFGHYGNKNVDLVLAAWALLDDPIPLRVLGVSDRAGLEARVHSLGLSGVVTVLPWLSEEQFRHVFASAALIVFPSDFEGFGLPAAEALRLSIPLVITPEPALLEVTGGHATVMAGWDARALADAVPVALRRDCTAAAREWIAAFTWARTAAQTRALLEQAITLRKR